MAPETSAARRGALAADHPAARAWRELAGSGEPSPAAVATLHTAHGSDVYRLDGVAGEVAIVAKRQWRPNVRLEAAVYEHVVPRLSSAGVRCLGVVDDPDERFAWLFLHDAGGAPYLPYLDGHRRLAGAWLAELHALGADTGGLPALPERTLDPYRRWLSSAQELLAGSLADRSLPDGERTRLERLLARCDAVASHWDELVASCAAAPTALVHGDFVARNLRVVVDAAAEPSLVALDWGDAGLGPPVLDLAQSPLRSTGFCANPDVRAYTRAARERGLDADLRATRRMAAMATVLRAVAATAWDAPELTSEWRRRPLEKMRFYEATLAHSLRELRWA